MEIDQSTGGVILKQNGYVERIEDPMQAVLGKTMNSDLLNGEQLTYLRRLVGKLNWAGRMTRPDLSFGIVDLSTKFNKAHGKDLRKATGLALRVRNTSLNNNSSSTIRRHSRWRGTP